MAHRHIYNTSQMFDADSDQQWNRLHSEDLYLHFARTNPTENSPNFPPGENVSADQVHYASQWNATARSNGYSSSSQLVNPIRHQLDSSDPPRDSLHQSSAPNVCAVPETQGHYASSSSYGVESSLFDISMGNGRGPYKRKSPGIPAMSERSSTNRYYSTGSSSGVSSLSEIRQDKLTLDAAQNHWEPLMAPPSYRGSHLSIRGESSARNVRSRSAVDLESDACRTHMSGHYSYHPSSNRPPVDHPGYLDHTNQNSNAPLPEWTPLHLSGGHHGRILPNNIGHESSHFFAGSHVNPASGELGGYHQEHMSSRNNAPPNMHSIPSHTRGVRSGYSHRSTLNTRVSAGNVRMGHMVPPNEDLQRVGDSHSSGHLRPFGSTGWRNGDRNCRPRLSSERYRLFSEVIGTHGRLTPEGHMVVDRSFYGTRSMLDHHRDMRLDIDSMSYEDLLALGERIGSVNTGVREDVLHKCLTESVYCSSDQVQEEGKCVICLDEYQHMDDVGTLKACGHDYHVKCIKKWLSMKNSCPICKGAAAPDHTND